MANTVTRDGMFLTLSAIDTDFLYTDLWSGRVPIISIDFQPAAATDKCVIREGSLTGPIIFSRDLDSDGVWESGGLVKYFQGQPIMPCMVVANGSYDAAALVIFHIGTK